MRKFHTLFFFCFSVQIFIVGLVVYIVNPHSKFNHRLFKPLASTSHEYKYYLFKKLKTTPEILILGSSRVATIDPNYVKKLTGKNTFNFSVNAAMIEDMLLINKFVYDHFTTSIDTCVIGIDIRCFKPKTTPNNGLSIFRKNDKINTNYYPISSLKDYWSSFKSMLSFEQVISAMKVLIFEYFTGWPEQKASYSSNGKLIYNNNIEEDRESLYIKIKETSKLYQNIIYKNFNYLDSTQVNNLIELLTLNFDANVHIKIFLTPIHPKTKEFLIDTNDYLFLKESLVSLLSDLNKTFSFDFYDLTDLETFGGSSSEFYDGEHIRSENGFKIIDYIFNSSLKINKAHTNAL